MGTAAHSLAPSSAPLSIAFLAGIPEELCMGRHPAVLHPGGVGDGRALLFGQLAPSLIKLATSNRHTILAQLNGDRRKVSRCRLRHHVECTEG